MCNQPWIARSLPVSKRTHTPSPQKQKHANFSPLKLHIDFLNVNQMGVLRESCGSSTDTDRNITSTSSISGARPLFKVHTKRKSHPAHVPALKYISHNKEASKEHFIKLLFLFFLFFWFFFLCDFGDHPRTNSCRSS